MLADPSRLPRAVLPCRFMAPDVGTVKTVLVVKLMALCVKASNQNGALLESIGGVRLIACLLRRTAPELLTCELWFALKKLIDAFREAGCRDSVLTGCREILLSPMVWRNAHREARRDVVKQLYRVVTTNAQWQSIMVEAVGTQGMLDYIALLAQAPAVSAAATEEASAAGCEKEMYDIAVRVAGVVALSGSADHVRHGELIISFIHSIIRV